MLCLKPLATCWSPTALKRPGRLKQCHCLQISQDFLFSHVTFFLDFFNSIHLGITLKGGPDFKQHIVNTNAKVSADKIILRKLTAMKRDA